MFLDLADYCDFNLAFETCVRPLFWRLQIMPLKLVQHVL